MEGAKDAGGVGDADAHGVHDIHVECGVSEGVVAGDEDGVADVDEGGCGDDEHEIGHGEWPGEGKVHECHEGDADGESDDDTVSFLCKAFSSCFFLLVSGCVSFNTEIVIAE